jgi:hypothetical protein
MVVAQPDGLPLDQQGQPRAGGALPRFLIGARQALALRRRPGRGQDGSQPRDLAQRLLEPLTGPPQRGRLFGQDLALDPGRGLAARAAQRRPRATRARASS